MIAAHGSLKIGRFGFTILWRATLHAADELARGVVKIGHVTKLEFQGTAVFLRNARRRHELLQSGLDFGLREDKDLGHSDGVKPALDPAPDGREEGGSTDDLESESALSNQITNLDRTGLTKHTKIRSSVSG